METERLNILTWNVRLLKFGDIDAFLTRMSGAFENWGILLIQEFYSGAKVFPKFSQDGHRVFATWPHRGSRRIGIIVHKRFIKFILPNSFGHLRRAASIDFSFGGFNLRVISAHLAQSGRTFEEFRQSVHDLNNIIDSRRPGFQLMIGIDAQGPLGPQHPDIFSDRVDPAFLGTRSFRGEYFFRELLVKQQLFAANTCAPQSHIDTDNLWTCNHDWHKGLRRVHTNGLHASIYPTRAALRGTSPHVGDGERSNGSQTNFAGLPYLIKEKGE